MALLSPLFAWAVAIGFFVAFVSVLVWRKLVGKRVPGYLALCEYWVYSQGDKLPEQTEIMERMISSNPHNRPGRPCIGAREGMLFTDIRLHIALALRSKNPLVFRPDIFAEDLVPSEQALSRLPSAKSLIKVRYLSEAILTDTRHLQFLPHLADTVSDLAVGTLVYDVVCEQIYSAEDFKSLLESNNNAERPDIHVRAVWKRDEMDNSGYAETKGLRKVGLKEMKTDTVQSDQEILVVGLLLRAAHELMRKPAHEGGFEYEEYGDTFVLEPREEKGEHTLVSIKRRRGN